MHPITAYANSRTDRVPPPFGVDETQLQRAIATIMFTDVEDSTGLASALGLVETTRFMIEHFTLTRQVVLAHGGIVQNFTGDGVLALWLESEMTPGETALSALAAVAELVPEISLSNAWRRSTRSLSRRVRIGLHSGEVMFVNDRQQDFSFLVGSEVNFARRVEQAGKRENGEGVDALVMVSGATLRLAGLSTAPVDPYQLVRLTPAELAGCRVNEGRSIYIASAVSGPPFNGENSTLGTQRQQPPWAERRRLSRAEERADRARSERL